MIDFKNKINHEAVSFKIASKCARTVEIYNNDVLKENKLNLNFLHHLRSLELDVCKEEILHSIVSAGDISPCSISIVKTNYDDILKIIANADLTSAFEALDCEDFYLRSTIKANGQVKNVYEVRFNLTL